MTLVVVLIDDVLLPDGRSVGLNAIMELGRPQFIELAAILVDRGHRELRFGPITSAKCTDVTKEEDVAVQLKRTDRTVFCQELTEVNKRLPPCGSLFIDFLYAILKKNIRLLHIQKKGL